MAGIIRSASVRLDAIVSPYMAGLSKASVATTAFARNTSAQLSGTTAKTQKLGQATGLLPGKFGALASVGGAAFAGVGLAAAGAIKTFADFDVAMDAVGASTGASGAELDKLGKTALDAAADTKFGATEAAGGIEALGKAGVETADIVGGGLKGALDLAAAGEIEVADAAEIAASALTQFNLKGEDVPHVADVIAAGAGKAQGSVSDMSMALQQSGLVASQMGLSLEETVGTLAAFASAGLIGSDAGTSFRTMLLRLANPTGEARDLMAELGVAAYDAQGNFVGMAALAGQLQTQLGHLTQAERDAAMATLFGSDAIRGANVLYKDGLEGISDWEGEVTDAGFATEQAAARTDNLRGDLERLGGELENLAIRAGGTAQGPLRDFVQWLESVAVEVDEEADIWGRWFDKAGDAGDWINEHLIPDFIGLNDVIGRDRQEIEAMTRATERAGEAYEAHSENLSGYAAAQEAATEETSNAVESNAALAEEMEKVREEQEKAVGLFLEGRDNVREWYQSVDDATAAIAENGATLDTTTEAGRNNEEALDDMAEAARGVLEDMTAAGENTDVASRQMRRALTETGIRMGMTEQDAEDYADQVIATAKLKINTPVAVNDTAAKEKLAAWNEAVRKGGGTITFSIRAIEAAGGVGGFMTMGPSRPGGMPFLGRYPVTQGPHDGGALDYGMPVGTPLFATFPGYLDNTNLGNRSYGMYYTLRGSGKYELGAHLSRFARGDGFVPTGALIGWSGNTGNSTGPHLHLLRNFAKGGLISHAPVGGSVPINAHGGEYVVNAGATAANRATLEAINSGRSGGGMVLRIESGGSRFDDALVEVLRRSVRVKGGNVQTVLGA